MINDVKVAGRRNTIDIWLVFSMNDNGSLATAHEFINDGLDT